MERDPERVIKDHLEMNPKLFVTHIVTGAWTRDNPWGTQCGRPQYYWRWGNKVCENCLAAAGSENDIRARAMILQEMKKPRR